MRSREKKAKLGIILLGGVVIIIGAFIGFHLSNGSAVDSSGWPKAEMVRRYIDGVWVRVGRENFYPIGVMIDNMIDSRPQVGLDQANLVWEAQAEAGISRFLAVFANGSAIEKIGPVRSARPYYLDWAQELDALYTHVGGSPEALGSIYRNNVVENLNEFYDYKYFWYDEQRLAPHNTFTSFKLLSQALEDKKISAQGNFDRWLFKDDIKINDRPQNEKKISIEFSKVYTPLYLVEWHYNRETNQYIRHQNQKTHLTADGREIKAKNIVLQYTTIEIIDEIGRRKIETLGEGRAVVFQDARAIEGKWKKESPRKRTKFYDQNEKEIEFNAGPTWLEVVSSNMKIDY